MQRPEPLWTNWPCRVAARSSGESLPAQAVPHKASKFNLRAIEALQQGAIMAKVILGNHSSVIVPQQDRDNIRKFYCDVLGGKITKGENDRDFLRLGEDFYIVFLYGDVPDESEFLRTARSVWLEIKSDNVEEMRRKIVESGLVGKLEIR